MADTKTRPNFEGQAALQNEPAKGSLDPERGNQPAPKDGAAKDRVVPSISQYQDPRDRLDQARHRMVVRAREIEAAAAGGPSASPDKE